MKIDDYFQQVTADPEATTRSQLTPSPLLHSLFANIGAVSEAQIREWAAPIYCTRFDRRLRANRRWKGQRTGVDWPEGIVMDPALVGTVHTHPYAKKLSEQAKVGFSIGDLKFYAQMQQNAPIKMHFVVCCRTVFLAVFRRKTVTFLARDGWDALETDENESDDYLLRHLDPDPRRAKQIKLARELDRDVADQSGDIDGSARIERALLGAAPDYAAYRWQANRRMIRAAAARLRFDLYWGKLGGTLHLKSNRTYLSGGVKGSWQKVFG